MTQLNNPHTSKFAPRFLLVCGCLLLSPLLPAADKESPLTPQQRQLNIQSFEYVWRTIRDTHWDPNFGGVDWQAVHNELRPKMDEATTMAKARALMQDMLRRLNQSHFAIIPAQLYKNLSDKPKKKTGEDESAGRKSEPSDTAATKDEESEEDPTGIDLRVVGNQALVTSVESPSPAFNIGVRPGWEILKINGEPIAPLIESVSEFYKDSSMKTNKELVLKRFIGSKLTGKIGKTVRVDFMDGSGKTVTLDVDHIEPPGTRAKFGFLPPQYVRFKARKLENAEYISFNMFLDPANIMQRFADAVQSCMKCGGMVIDLRGNPGGIGFMAVGMAGWFIDAPDQRLGTMYMRNTPLNFVVNPRIETYRGPLAILVDGASASTSEILAGGMKDLHRARIFGTRTAGAALPSAFEKLPNEDGFQYAVANYISEGGKPLEGIGVTPDVEVAPTRAALLEGRDLPIESALSWIRAQKK